MKFEVSRKTWLRGEGAGASYLCRATDKKQCCLGFRAAACGSDIDTLVGVRSPVGLAIQNKEAWPGFIHAVGGSYQCLKGTLCFRLMQVNDDKDTNDVEREKHLTALFKEVGDEVVFVD